jgi:hypothetical protein
MKPFGMRETERTRRFFAAALMILLPAMTSWASACDLSCSLPQFHSICDMQGTEERAEAGHTWEHVMDQMEMGDESSAAAQEQSGFIYLHDSCTHNSCNEPSLSAIAKRGAEHRAHGLQFVRLELPAVRLMRSQKLRVVNKEGPPNLQPFDPLSVILRI